MSLVAALRNTLNPLFVEFDSVFAFDLSEPANISGCQRVSLGCQSNSILVCKLDVNINDPNTGQRVEKFPFFLDGCPKRICDYLIFYEKNNTLYCLICELKSNTISGSKNQLAAGCNLAKYFIHTAKRCSRELHQRIKYRALLFSSNVVYKSLQRDHFFANDQEIYFAHYLCNQKYSLDSFCN